MIQARSQKFMLWAISAAILTLVQVAQTSAQVTPANSKDPIAKPAVPQAPAESKKTAPPESAKDTKPAEAKKPVTEKAGEKAGDKAADTADAARKASKSDAKDEPSDKAAAHKVILEESKYRKRMAKINRLRELAKAQGNQERLAALDKLEARTNELHDRKIADAKSKLGDEKFKEVDKHLSQGRGHGNPHGVPPGLSKKGVTDPPGKGRDDAGPAKHEDHDGKGDKPKDKDKDEKDKDDDHGKATKNKDKDHGKPDHGGKP
jgi:hypothetical protein